MDLPTVNGLSLCAGAGGLDLGIEIALPRYRTICFVERDCYPASTLAGAMAQGALAPAPIWDDLASFDGRPWRGLVDILAAGLPCQPYSIAGKRRGHEDERALWPEAIRIIEESEPALVWLENVVEFLRHFEPIGDRLSALGYRIAAGIFSAAEVGAPHRRERFFALAYRDGADVSWLADAERAEWWAHDECDAAAGERQQAAGGARSGSGELADADYESRRTQFELESKELDAILGPRSEDLADANGKGFDGAWLRAWEWSTRRDVTRASAELAHPHDARLQREQGALGRTAAITRPEGFELADADRSGRDGHDVGASAERCRSSDQSCDHAGAAGTQLADAAGRGCGERGESPSGRERFADGDNARLADAIDGELSDALGEPEKRIGPGPAGEVVGDAEGEQRERSLARPDGEWAGPAITGEPMGHAGGTRLEGRNFRPDYVSDRWRPFPPSPAAGNAWRAILDADLTLSPALSRFDLANRVLRDAGLPEMGVPRTNKRAGRAFATYVRAALAQPEIRGMATILAAEPFAAVRHRIDRLRSLGNGVVPICAAYAFVCLAQELGLIRKGER